MLHIKSVKKNKIPAKYLIFKLISCLFQNNIVYLHIYAIWTLPEMRRSSVLENRRKQVNPEIREAVDLSFQIVDRIHEILTEKGLKQKDLAMLLGKKEAEISKWMRGTHNFTIDTLVAIERALQAPILQVIHQEEVVA